MARDGNDDDEFRKYSTREQLERYFAKEIESRLEEVEDDQIFCEKEIESANAYLQKINETFMNRMDQLRRKLQEAENNCSSIIQENRQICERDIEDVNRLFTANQLSSGNLSSLIE